MNMSKEVLRLKIRNIYSDLTARLRVRLLKEREFTIISNNCWAGFVYQSYKLPYQTPTIGLFIPSSDFIKMISHLEYYLLECKLEFINPSNSSWREKMCHKANWGTYPIGRLDDIEIHFLHYKSQREAKEKWYRRIERMNWDRLIVKFNDQNFCTLKDIHDFYELAYENKVCFVSKQGLCVSDAIYIKECSKYKEVRSSYEPFGKSKYINVNEVINNINCKLNKVLDLNNILEGE